MFALSDLKSDLDIRALGLLVGGTGYGTTIVTPIWAVLEKLNLPLKLLEFKPGSSRLPQPHSRLDRVEKDVEDIKSNVSKLTHQTDQKMNIMEGKIDQVDKNTNHANSKLDKLINLLANGHNSIK